MYGFIFTIFSIGLLVSLFFVVDLNFNNAKIITKLARKIF